MAVALLAGCGGHDATSTAAAPRLPKTLAADLADRARAIRCGETAKAAALQRRVIRAINRHRVPAALQEELLSRTTAVVGRIDCDDARPHAAVRLATWLDAND